MTTPTAVHLRNVLATLVAIIVSLTVSTTAAGAQTAGDGAIPILTVADAAVERCEAIAVTGSAFAPETDVSIAVNGTPEEDGAFTDPAGTFTFTTTVACEQSSGAVQIRASDGATSIAIDVAVGAAPAPVAVAGTSARGPSAASRAGGLAVPALRAVLAAVLAAELVVLWRLRQRRRARRSRTEAAVPAA